MNETLIEKLVERLKNGTCDEIDIDMLVSRVERGLMEALKATSEYVNKMKEIQNLYKEELILAGFGVVVGCKENIICKDKAGIKMIVGKSSVINDLISDITKEISHE